MKPKIVFTTIVILSAVFFLVGTDFTKPSSFSRELEKLDLSEALVFRSQSLDEVPRWSDDGVYLYIDDAGTWKRIHLDTVRLTRESWKEEVFIGIAKSGDVQVVSVDDVPPETSEPPDPRKVTTSSGIVIQLIPENLFGVALVISNPGQEPQVMWKSDLENCHSLVLSPHETYVAYKCELSGLIVRKL